MTTMILGCCAGAFSAARFFRILPVCRGEAGGLACFHGGKTGEDVFEVFPRVDAEAAAVLDESVNDGGFFAGVLGSDEEPVFVVMRICA